jgi:hypothetical protein
MDFKAAAKGNLVGHTEAVWLTRLLYPQVYHIELGKINSTISTVYILTKTLKISLKELFDF